MVILYSFRHSDLSTRILDLFGMNTSLKYCKLKYEIRRQLYCETSDENKNYEQEFH